MKNVFAFNSDASQVQETHLAEEEEERSGGAK
jgi:hypothetical protein